jgi:hypothetical protein
MKESPFQYILGRDPNSDWYREFFRLDHHQFVARQLRTSIPFCSLSATGIERTA